MTGRWRDIWGFLAFSHGWTWTFWAAAAVAAPTVWAWPAVALFVTGGAGVLLGGLVSTRVILGRAGLLDLGHRLVEVRRATRGWWAVILLLYPALTLLAAGVTYAVGASSQPLDLEAAWSRLLSPLTLVAMAGFILIIGPLPEEIGLSSRSPCRAAWAPPGCSPP